MAPEKLELLTRLEELGFDKDKFKRLGIEKLKVKVEEAEAEKKKQAPEEAKAEEPKPSDVPEPEVTEESSDENSGDESSENSSDENSGDESNEESSDENSGDESNEESSDENSGDGPEITTEEAFEIDEFLTNCQEVKMAALKKRHIAKARFATLLELTMKSPRPTCSHAMKTHFNSILPRPNANNFNKDVYELFEQFKKYIADNHK